MKIWGLKIGHLRLYVCVCVYTCTSFSSSLLGANKNMIYSSNKKSLKNKTYYFPLGAEFPIQYLVESIIETEAKLYIVIDLEQHHF